MSHQQSTGGDPYEDIEGRGGSTGGIGSITGNPQRSSSVLPLPSASLLLVSYRGTVSNVCRLFFATSTGRLKDTEGRSVIPRDTKFPSLDFESEREGDEE